jgi:tetratricopeptide (TPR) repeat protein
MSARVLSIALCLCVPALLGAQTRTKSVAHTSEVESTRRACLLRGGTDAWRANARDEVRQQQRVADSASRAAAFAHLAHDAPGEAEARMIAASALMAIDSVDRAFDMVNAAIAVLRRADTPAMLANALSGLGAVYAARDQHDRAFAAYRESLSQPRVDAATAANTLNSLGMTYYAVGRLDSAFIFLDSALKIADPADTAMRSDALNNVGLVHLERGSNARSDADRAQIDSAIDAFKASLDTLGESDLETRATTLGNIGVAERRLFQLGDGREHLDSALVVYRQAAILEDSAGLIRTLARTCHNIALIHGDQGDVHSRDELANALRVHASTKDRYWQGMAVAELAGSWRRLEPRDYRRAARLYDSAAVVFSSIATNAGGDANRLGFAEQRLVLGMFDDWALTSLHLPVSGPSAALRAAERGRAQALLQLMRHGAPNPTPSTINFPSLSYLVTRDTLIVWLTESSGAVHASVVPIVMDSLSAFVGDARAAIGALSNQSGIQRRGGFGSLDSTTRPPVPIDSALRRLSHIVLPADLRAFLPSDTSDLVIVPGGALGLVPFAALPIADDDHQPLGLRYALRYAPSFATLALADAEAKRRPDPRTSGWAHSIVLGDPVMPNARDRDGAELLFGPLANARSEATWLADSLRISPLLDAAATEDTVRSLLPNAPLVHLATHGLAYDRDDRARDSFVALASGRKNDGLLTVGEILDEKRPMRASLVVLSACETALGNLKQAEGTVGLQRAFLARGASSVLVSLWGVDDDATALLMRRFYAHWLYDPERPSKAEALRLAQVDVRNKVGEDRPDLWAAFQLVGAR